MLSIKNVSKTFGDIVALEDISFDVGEGEFVFLTGPSGAGKTTVLRLIIREILPDLGEIIFEDKDLTKLKGKEIPALRQEMGVVFQDFKVLPEKTLRENVEIALAVCGLAKEDWKSRVDHVLELVDLYERAELFPSQISGGELQRASLARALVVNPKIILADEPTGNLDWDTADRLMDLFSKINKEGKTIIMATHHKLIVDKYGKKVIELEEGRMKGARKPPARRASNPEGREEGKAVIKEKKEDKKPATTENTEKDTENTENSDDTGSEKRSKKVEVKVKDKKEDKKSLKDKLKEKLRGKK